MPVAAVAILIAAAAWVAVRGLNAKGDLEQAAAEAAAVQKAVAAQDVEAATAHAARLERHASSAASLTGDPIWRAAEIVPWAGPNLVAVRTMAAGLEQASAQAITPMVELSRSFGADDLRPKDGAIDLAPLAEAAPTVKKADAALADVQRRLGNVSPDGLIDAVAGARARLVAAIAEARGFTTALHNTLALAPAMLGADGPRHWLVLFLNNAELRTAGGIPGEFALVDADGGAVRIVRQASSSDFPALIDPALSVEAATTQAFGDNVGTRVQNITSPPRFEQAADMAAELWTRTFGGSIDGVIAIDPVALSYVLDATGPVKVDGSAPLTAADAVHTLLVDTYARTGDQAAQDAYFNGAAVAAFQALSSGQADPRKLVRALERAGQEHRLSIWSARADEQKVLLTTSLSGLAEAQALDPSTYGVYLNDATGGKMDVYLDVHSSATGIRTADGRTRVDVSVSLTNTAPADAATALPFLVTAGGFYGVPAGSIATNVTVAGAKGAFENGVLLDDAVTSYAAFDDDGRILQSIRSTLAPGQSETYVFSYLLASDAGTPTILQTPTAAQ